MLGEVEEALADLFAGDLDWRAGRPKLTALQASLEARPSFRETAPA